MEKEQFASQELLNELQGRSWELELIISGIALFGLFEIYEWVEAWQKSNIDLTNSNIDYLYTTLHFIADMSVIVFIINLSLHILLRGLWVGSIGLRSLSGDIDFEELRYNKKFTNYFKNNIGSFDYFIQKIDFAGSVIFAYTFLLFFVIISISITPVVIISTFHIIFNYLFEDSGLFFILFLVAFFLLLLLFFSLLLVAVDFLTLGALKKIKNKYFTFYYYYLYRLINIISLAFIWHPILLNFLDHKKLRWMVILTLPYMVSIGLIEDMTHVSRGNYPTFFCNSDIHHEHFNIIDGLSYNYNYYDDERLKREEYRINNLLTIPAKVITGPFLEVFISSQAEDNYLITPTDSSKNKQTILEEGFYFFSEKVICHKDRNVKEYEKYIHEIKTKIESLSILKIDDTTIQEQYCQFYEHPNGREKGLLCFVPTNSLTTGPHRLTIERQLHDGFKKDTVKLTIPFMYAKE